MLGLGHSLLLPGKFSCQIEEGLLKVVIALSRNLIVLQVLLPVEGHLLCLHLPVLHINLVTAKNYRNVLAHPDIIHTQC